MEGAQLVDGTLPANLHRTHYGAVEYGGDESLFAEFYWGIKKNHFDGDGLFLNGTGEQTIGQRVLMLRILCSRRQTVEREAREDDKRRFRRQYDAFLAGEDQKLAQGTPLEIAPFLDEAWREQLNFFRIYSLEQLIAVDDSGRQHFPMGFMQLQQKVRDFLTSIKQAAPVVRIERENDKLREDNDAMRQQMNDLQRTVSVLQNLVQDQAQNKRPRSSGRWVKKKTTTSEETDNAPSS